MRGVIEEHNGVKFKTISASGTTGIWPTRQSIKDGDSGKGLSLFGGTLGALGGFRDAVDAFSSSKQDDTPEYFDPIDDEGGTHTGYFQAQLLQQFLEQYAMAKKLPENKSWRLVFDCPKTNESFVVTPMQYTVNRSQRSPGEFLYNMQFKAWKRIEIGKGSESDKGFQALQSLSPGFFSKLLTTLNNVRGLISAAMNVVKAIRADFARIFSIIRAITSIIKAIAGFILAIVDLPNKIINDLKDVLKGAAEDLRAAGQSIKDAGDILSKYFGGDDRNEGLSGAAVEAGQLGIAARDAARVSPVNNLFDEPEAFFDFFSVFNVDDLELTAQQRDAIDADVELNSLISTEEIRGFVQEMVDFTLDLSNYYGAGDAFFSELTGRPEPKKRATPMSIEEFELLAALEEAVSGVNSLIATREFDDGRIESSLEYVGGLADDSLIPFNSSSTAKKLVPVPFNLTIEQITARYLGNPDRYNEIITINNLRSPYIDEDGFFYNFLSNGDSRQFNIDNNENLYIGQKIQISSNTVPTFVRKITAIEKITDSNYLVTVDGISDLNLLTTSDQAKMKAFLPGTVNSQNQIYIPTDAPIDAEPRTYDIPYLEGDTLTGLSKIDWLLDDSGDIVLNSFGEVGLANGTTNLIQALKMKVSTQKGQMLSDTSFGLGLSPGVITSDVAIESVLNDLRKMVLQDSRFSSVDKIEIELLTPDLAITINARLAGGRGIFPINFTV
jgi:hypothetical protein